jgi:GH35 family endo-1,4-beta-xylanase
VIRTLGQLPQTEAAVNEFVAAMAGAGVQLITDAVILGLTTKEITGKDGKAYEVALTEDGYLLLIKGGAGGEWEEPTGSNIVGATGIDLSVFVGGYGSVQSYSQLKATQRRFFASPSVFNSWKDTARWGSAGVDDDYKTATQYGAGDLLMHPLIWEEDLPDSVSTLTGEQLRSALLNRVRQTVAAYPKATRFTVNELSGSFLARIGSVQEQQKLMHDIRTAVKSGDPNRMLILSDTLNHGSDSYNGNSNERFEAALERFGHDIDLIGIQLTVDAGHAPPEGWDQMIHSRIRFYYERYGKGIVVTELNVNMRAVSDADRLIRQAEIYESLARGIQRANSELGNVCRQINVLTIGDRFSPFETNPGQYGYSVNADPTLFDDNLKRKPAWYRFIAGLLW